MKRIIIVCEGETEREFCKDVLAPHLRLFAIHTQHPLIKQSRGGMVEWPVLKRQLEMHLKQEPHAYVTTFIDLYGIKARHGFPGFTEIGATSSSNRVQAMEDGMLVDLPEKFRYRFYPYVQLHEFEALLFSDVTVIKANFSDEELAGADELDRIAAAYPNPEDINDSPETAPSKRLKRILPAYNKVVYGAMLTQEIGMNGLMTRCSHFREWVEKLCALGQEN